MTPDIEELRSRYSSLSTDELVYIKTTGSLTPMAKMLLDAELSKRSVDPDDFAHAAKFERARKAEIESAKKGYEKKFWNIVITAAVVGLLAVYLKFFT